jgi:hypothetical protein
VAKTTCLTPRVSVLPVPLRRDYLHIDFGQRRHPAKASPFFEHNGQSPFHFEPLRSFGISAAAYSCPPMILMEAFCACSGRSLCHAMIASCSVGKSVETAPLWRVAGRLRSRWIFASSLIGEARKAALRSARHLPSLLVRLVNKAILNFNGNLA